ncbi:hypothetical protein [Mangrovibacterium lignilyticum]|uniref:hypothetical protein n=1 Tax=Mangrovibacterium lignilyticum TaxID=2668052 RepID=UPI0013D6E086|nr:hypothetical protein [Mangrovibacterium lignilyticum]
MEFVSLAASHWILLNLALLAAAVLGIIYLIRKHFKYQKEQNDLLREIIKKMEP